MAGGRPTKGLDHVDKIDATKDVKDRMKAILQTISGELSVQDAAAKLGIGESRFHELRDEFLRAGSEGLAPKPKGRPAHKVAPEDKRIDELEHRVKDLEVELQAARVREEIALAMPQVVERQAAEEAVRQEREKKTAKRKKEKEQRKSRKKQRRIAKKK